jgi:hypothetical protein
MGDDLNTKYKTQDLGFLDAPSHLDNPAAHCLLAPSFPHSSFLKIAFSLHSHFFHTKFSVKNMHVFFSVLEAEETLSIW